MNRANDPTEAEIARLQILIENRLAGRIHGLRIRFENNGLVLEGRTRTYYTKQLAQHAAMKESPLPIRINAIEVW
jgi:hypothetical protein